MKSIKIEAQLYEDLKLVKRVRGHKNISEVIRELMNARNYNAEWCKHMRGLLEDSA